MSAAEPIPAGLPARVRSFGGPILVGAAVAIVGVAPWLVLARLNAHLNPELPWAALAMATFLALYIVWLNGAGWPSRWRAARRESLRLWRPTPRAWTREGLGPTLTITAIFVLLTLVWILVGAPAQPPDLSPYPTTAYRFSILIMGAVVSGVVEEVAFRGYMQSRLERFGTGRAIVITSIVFTLFHANHGLELLLTMGPGFFIASALYGMLAYHTGSIIPGAVIHTLGDLSFTYFGTLGGDYRLLFVA